MAVRKVVIPAAGLGTRFYPLTKAQPKEMLPIVDRPVIHYVVDEAVRSGLDEVLIIVGKNKESIINYFDAHDLDNRLGSHGLDKFPDIFYVRQKTQQGLADAIRYARKFVGNEPFVVMLGDVIYGSEGEPVIKQLIDVYEKHKCTVITVEKAPKEKIKDYGIIDGRLIGDGLWLIGDMVEKPNPEEAPSDMAIAGAYLFTPSIFDYIEQLKPGKNGEYQITDAMQMQCKREKVLGYQFRGKKYDVGTKELWIKAFVEFAERGGWYKDDGSGHQTNK